MKRAVRTSLALALAVLTTGPGTGCMAKRELLQRAAGVTSAQPASSAPDPSAGQPLGDGTMYRTITFMRGTRKLETTVIWPSTGGERLPVVLFAHGLGEAPPFYGELLKIWAASGFVVAAPAFPGTRFGAEKLKILDVLNQPADLSAVLDGLIALDPSDPIRKRLDPDRVAAAGHSAGAITALGLFSADTAMGRDKRIDAAVIMAGNTLGVGDRFIGDPAPILFVHAEYDATVPTATGRAAYRAVPWPKGFLTLPGTQHTSPYRTSADPAFATVALATTDFLRWALLKDSQALRSLRQAPGLESNF
jgi:fermentation-respiration switch protein FrsA (DUF1100 family)